MKLLNLCDAKSHPDFYFKFTSKTIFFRINFSFNLFIHLNICIFCEKKMSNVFLIFFNNKIF